MPVLPPVAPPNEDLLEQLLVALLGSDPASRYGASPGVLGSMVPGAGAGARGLSGVIARNLRRGIPGPVRRFASPELWRFSQVARIPSATGREPVARPMSLGYDQQQDPGRAFYDAITTYKNIAAEQRFAEDSAKRTAANLAAGETLQKKEMLDDIERAMRALLRTGIPVGRRSLPVSDQEWYSLRSRYRSAARRASASLDNPKGQALISRPSKYELSSAYEDLLETQRGLERAAYTPRPDDELSFFERIVSEIWARLLGRKYRPSGQLYDMPQDLWRQVTVQGGD